MTEFDVRSIRISRFRSAVETTMSSTGAVIATTGAAGTGAPTAGGVAAHNNADEATTRHATTRISVRMFEQSCRTLRSRRVCAAGAEAPNACEAGVGGAAVGGAAVGGAAVGGAGVAAGGDHLTGTWENTPKCGIATSIAVTRTGGAANEAEITVGVPPLRVSEPVAVQRHLPWP